MQPCGMGDAGWDFFVSYTQADRAWAEWIAWNLEQDGHRVLIQAWDSVPGSNWIHFMQDGASNAARTVAVLSDAYLESVFGAAEWQAAWHADPAGAERKLLIVRVGACARPGLLSGVTGIDLFDLDEPEAKARLQTAVAAALSGRAKPSVPPHFPGSGETIPRQSRFPGGLPTIWRVPARNPNFKGRTDDLQRLERAFVAGSSVAVRSIHGLGGVGKTQLATEYVHLKARSYDLVWWVDAEKSATIPDQFARLAEQLGLEPAGEPETLQAQVHDALRRVAGWLLVFDNAHEIDTVQPWMPAVPLPPGTPGHVLVTTRRGGFGALGQVFDLDVLDMAAAVELVLARVPALERRLAVKIATAVGRLPLALEQAAAYLDRSQMPAEEYLALLKDRTAEMLDKGQVAARKDTVASVWTLFRAAGCGEPLGCPIARHLCLPRSGGDPTRSVHQTRGSTPSSPLSYHV